jgi:hypothetical protein
MSSAVQYAFVIVLISGGFIFALGATWSEMRRRKQDRKREAESKKLAADAQEESNKKVAWDRAVCTYTQVGDLHGWAAEDRVRLKDTSQRMDSMEQRMITHGGMLSDMWRDIDGLREQISEWQRLSGTNAKRRTKPKDPGPKASGRQKR